MLILLISKCENQINVRHILLLKHISANPMLFQSSRMNGIQLNDLPDIHETKHLIAETAF